MTEASAASERMLPLYVGKTIHQFDHRWSTFEGSNLRDVTDDERRNPNFQALPHDWVHERDVLKKAAEHWFVGFRDIARATDSRTTISAPFPYSAVGNKLPLLTSAREDLWLLAAILNSFVHDYISRQKVGSTSLNFFLVKQFPVLPPDVFATNSPWADSLLTDWFGPRVLELSYTAWDMQPFAEDLGDAGAPFRWDPERRFLLRCELDAAFFRLYGVARDDVDYIMETFSTIHSEDDATYGEYRTKRIILEVFDRMQSAIDTGTAYRTILDPAPGNGPRHPNTRPASGG